MSTYLNASKKLDFTLTVPPDLFISPARTFEQQRCKVPTVCKDKLHPSRTTPFAEYVDEGIWKTRVTYQKDPSYSALRSQIEAKYAELSATPLKDLDTVCGEELRRRFPYYQLIDGVKAKLKDQFPILAKWFMGAEGFCQKLTRKEVDRLKKQISFSAINRDDLISTPTIQSPALRSLLQLKDDAILQTEHLFAKNSPMNGKCFHRDGKTISLSQGIACTSDRTVENMGNLRVIQTKSRESLCYTGRPDTDHKALEQASFIFFHELKSKRKGITETKDEKGNTVYQLDYVVNSLLSAPWIWKKESFFASFPEREYLENEIRSLAALKANGEVTIEDPNAPGVKIRVRFNPILFSRSLNAFNRLENWLPPFVTGAARAEEVSELGFSTLHTLVRQKLDALRSQQKDLDVAQKIAKIESALQVLEQHQKDHSLLPHEELLIHDYLCKLLNLPCVYHCKSSLDRTSLPIAISTVLQQWIDLKLPLPDDLRALFHDIRFKELFAANWMAGHQVTRYTCNRKGTVAGEKLKTKTLGLTLHRGVYQNPAVAHLVPERYLTDFPMNEWIKAAALYTFFVIPLTLIGYIPLAIITAFRNIAYYFTGRKNHHWIGPRRFTFPYVLPTLLFNFHFIFPKKVLNEDSPQVRDRKLIAEDKKH